MNRLSWFANRIRGLEPRSATPAANSIVLAKADATIADGWLPPLVDPLRGVTLGTSAANKAVTADANNFVGIGLAPVAGYRLAASSIYCLNQALFNGVFAVGDTSSDLTTGGLYFARAGAAEPFIRFRSGSGSTAGSQIRGVVGGGIRFTTDDTSVEWGRVNSTGFSTALRILVGAGSATAPTFSFGANTGTGIYCSATNTLEFATSSTRQAFLNAGGLTVTSSGDQGAFRWFGNSGFGVRIQNTGTGGADYRIGVSADTWSIGGGCFVITPDNTSVNSVFTIKNGRIGFGSGNTNPKTTIFGIGSTVIGVATSAVADADLVNGQCNFYLDETAGNLMCKIKTSTGAIRTVTLVMAV